MEWTERDCAEVLGVELPEEQPEQEDAPASGGEPEAAQDTAQSGADSAETVESGNDDASGGEDVPEEDAPVQSAEERRRQAHGRRQRELASQRQAARDDAFAEMFAGQMNPYTNTPIRTEADWRAYRDAMEQHNAEEELRRAGIDPRLVRGMVEAEVRPLKEQARQQELTAIGQQARAVSAQADAAIQTVLESIRQLYGASVQSVEDVLAMATGAAFGDYVQKGLSLEDAYYMANRADIDRQRMAAAKQAGVNQARGKSHMAAPAPAASPAAYVATPEEAAAYREFMPNATDKEINAAYGRYRGGNK